MALDIGQIGKDMFAAAFAVLKDKAPQIKNVAQTEFSKIAQTIGLIGQELAEGRISEDEAKILLDMQKSATRSVLLMAEGLSLLVAEQALNAALGVVRVAVNGALGFALL
jgi:hypothetical protein